MFLCLSTKKKTCWRSIGDFSVGGRSNQTVEPGRRKFEQTE